VIEQGRFVDGFVGQVHLVPGVTRLLSVHLAWHATLRAHARHAAGWQEAARLLLGLALREGPQERALPGSQAARVRLEIEGVGESHPVIAREVILVELARPLGAVALLHRGREELSAQVLGIHRQA